MELPEDFNTGLVGELLDNSTVVLALALILGGVGLLILGIVTASTGLFTALFDMSVYGSWRFAGVFAGLGLPLLIIGIFTVLPATEQQRLGAGIGLGLVVLGVILFALNFPHNWYGDETDRTFLVVSIYFLGMMLTIVYLFLAVANLQTPSPTSAAPTSNSPHARHSSRNQNPQTAGALVQGVVGMVLDSVDTGDSADDDELDLDLVIDALEEHMEHRVTESEIRDGHVIVTRSKETQHAEFTTKLPGYVEIVDRDNQQYALAVDDVSFRLSH